MMLACVNHVEGDSTPRRHPRRRPASAGKTPPHLSLLNLHDKPSTESSNPRLCKSETFHSSPTHSDSRLRLPSPPHRSSTCPAALEAIAAGKQRMSKILDTLDLDSFSTSKSNATLEDDLPVPRSILRLHLDSLNTSSRPESPSGSQSSPKPAHIEKVNHHTSDSGLGSSVCSEENMSTKETTSPAGNVFDTLLAKEQHPSSAGERVRVVYVRVPVPCPHHPQHAHNDSHDSHDQPSGSGSFAVPSVPSVKRAHSTSIDPQEAIRVMARRRKDEPPMNINAPCPEPGCDRIFSRRCDLKKHVKTHERPYKCVVAGCKFVEKGFPTEKERERHHNDRHNPNAPKFPCQFEGCTYASKREANLKQHMEKNHKWEYVRTKTNGKKVTPRTTPETPSLRTTPGTGQTFPTPNTFLTPSPNQVSWSAADINFADPPVPNPVGTMANPVGDFQLFTNGPMRGDGNAYFGHPGTPAAIDNDLRYTNNFEELYLPQVNPSADPYIGPLPMDPYSNAVYDDPFAFNPNDFDEVLNNMDILNPMAK
ncbi:hypothetical protein BDV59DRAFT_168088 [Aspergillus ambiguus]|uniref:putative C2H2 transcription factor (Ace1) n=1 Tax=Aspergillus ambiguus TaxID=176160 RepID=UPI003CCD2303